MKGDESPKGSLILRTLPMPSDTNPHGDIFGGWIMSQMDIAGSLLAREITCSRVVTVAVESIVFIKPVQVGDVVACYGKLVKVGSTSLTINLEVWVKQAPEHPEQKSTESLVTEAAFTYVSVNREGKKQVIKRSCEY